MRKHSPSFLNMAEETLNVEFDEFNESDRTFSAYNAIVSETALNKSEGELSYLMTLGNEFSMQFPVEFIEVMMAHLSATKRYGFEKNAY